MAPIPPTRIHVESCTLQSSSNMLVYNVDQLDRNACTVLSLLFRLFQMDYFHWPLHKAKVRQSSSMFFIILACLH
ncbi:hypothetical protein Mapa_000980 [Marchantia paleacea]|nr:hypothetical protein Mapa_000980 [Marchantia paleacea]